MIIKNEKSMICNMAHSDSPHESCDECYHRNPHKRIECFNIDGEYPEESCDVRCGHYYCVPCNAFELFV